MQGNVGKTDRITRFVVGLLIIGYGMIVHNWFGLIGSLPLLTGLVGWCPMYLPFKINTVKSES